MSPHRCKNMRRMSFGWINRALSLTVLCLVLPLCLSAQEREESDDKTVLTASDIRAMNVLKIQDALSRVAGVKASDASVSIRGSSNVMVFMDGRPINDLTAGTGSVKWDMIPLDIIDKIEIYKSKGGLEYGENTSGGVVLITTKKIDSLHASASCFFGNFNRQNYGLSLQGQHADFGAALSAGFETTDGFVQNSDQKKWRIQSKTDYRASSDFSLNLSGDYTTVESGLRGLPENRTPHARQDYDALSVALGAKYRSTLSRTFVTLSETRNDDIDRNLHTFLRSTKVGQHLTSSIPVFSFGNFNTGTGFEWEGGSGSQFSNHSETRAWIFASKTVPVSAFSVSAGARQNFYTGSFSNTLNPELKIGYKKPAAGIEFSANLTNNLPTFRQRFNETSTTRPNPDLKQEKATNLSLSSFLKLDSVTVLTVSVFNSSISNRITYVRDDAGIGRYENFGKVTYQGFDASLNWSPFNELSFRPSYIYLHARNEETGLWLPAIPFHQANLDVTVKPFYGFSLTGNIKYVSKVYTTASNTGVLDAYALVNVSAEYSTGNIRVFLDVDNAMDKAYKYVDGYDAPPREWALGMNYQF